MLTEVSDEDVLKQRVMNLLAEWNQLLLNDFSDGRWARTSSELRDSTFSLVYVSKRKFQGERYVSVHNAGNLNIPFLNSYRNANIWRWGPEHFIRLKTFF